MNDIGNTVGSWFDTSEERRSGFIGIGAMAMLLGVSKVYSSIENLYPDDALLITGMLGVGVIGTGFGGVYAYGKKAGQPTDPIINTPETVPEIDREEIREVVERELNVVEDEVEDDVETVSDDIIEGIDRKPFDELMSDLKNKMFHLFLPSTSGSGKTVLIHHFLETQLDEKDSYIILNGKIEGNDTLKFPRSRFTTNDPKQYSKVLGKVVVQMKKREKNSTYKYPKLYVVIDESSLLDSDSMDLVVELLSRSRSANIKVILMTQSISVKINGTEGISDLLNRITILNLGFDEKKDRVLSYAHITSGKIKNFGPEIRVPHLDTPWNIDLEFRDDTSSFDFGEGTDTTIQGGAEVLPSIVDVSIPLVDNQTKTMSVEAITQFAMMLSTQTGVDLDGVVEEYVTETYGNEQVVDECLTPMLTPRNEIYENKYNFQPSETDDSKIPPLGVTVNIIKNTDLSDSGMASIGDTIITNGDIIAIKYLNTLSQSLPDKEKIGRKAMSHYIWKTNSRFHYKALTEILGDK